MSTPLSDADAERLIGPPKAIILLSGGLDSATTLFIAKAKGFECHAISFHYAQRHSLELYCAEDLAKEFCASYRLIELGRFPHASMSALTTREIDVPEPSEEDDGTIPVTYIPARNLIFLSYAIGIAEMLECNDIFIGVNAIDYSGYPDCRPEFITAFEQAINLGTKRAVEGLPYTIHTPLITMTKGEIITHGLELKVPYHRTSSCYNPAPNGKPCLKCDSCKIRLAGFKAVGLPDPKMI